MDGDILNTYDREKLYKEVWDSPVTKVAQTYGVSDSAIHKICKSMNIPKPQPGYWAKVKAGKSVEKIPLPPDDNNHNKITSYRQEENTPENIPPISFLPSIEQKRLLEVISNIVIDPNEKFSKHVMKYKKSARFIACVSPLNLNRALIIIDTIINALIQLGYYSSNDNDRFINVRGQMVYFNIYEMQDKINHILTKEENHKLEIYYKEKLRNNWVNKPIFPSYDYTFNGRLAFNSLRFHYIRDTKSVKIEQRLPDIITQLIQQSEISLNENIEYERKRKQQEEERRQEELRKEQYNNEIAKLEYLIENMNDFNVATKIRDYIKNVEQNNANGTMSDWITWAKDKADWYDPTINKIDSIFGQRDHSKPFIPDKKHRY